MLPAPGLPKTFKCPMSELLPQLVGKDPYQRADLQSPRRRLLVKSKETGLSAFLLEDPIQNKRFRSGSPSLLSWRI